MPQFDAKMLPFLTLWELDTELCPASGTKLILALTRLGDAGHSVELLRCSIGFRLMPDPSHLKRKRTVHPLAQIGLAPFAFQLWNLYYRFHAPAIGTSNVAH
jgi:hypothetical protein